MDFNEKYSKCDSINHIKSTGKFQCRKYEREFALKLEQAITEINIQRCIRVNKESNNCLSELEKLTSLLNTSNCYHQVLKEHSKSMYNQLKYLTAVELQKQNTKLNTQINNLSHERITITQLLVDFMDKKKLNQKRLIQELEAQNIEFETTTKWLSQYSNLVNNLPSELTFAKTTINPTLLHQLCSVGGSHLLLFVLENELKLPLTKEYLVNMGVCSLEDQEILINTLNNFPIPSAPPETEFSPSAPSETEFPPSAPSEIGFSSTTNIDEVECIVCMETQFDVLFVPCGHLCCCWECSEKIKLCPMCRTEILNKYDIKNIT